MDLLSKRARSNGILILGSIFLSVVSCYCWDQRRKKEREDLQNEILNLRQEIQRIKSGNNATKKKNGNPKDTNDQTDENGLRNRTMTNNTKKKEEPGDNYNNDLLMVKRVGSIRSIYRLCVGTPRQGLLAPHARGCIEMTKLGSSNTFDSVMGLEGYSHIWIVFQFHLNTQSSNSKRIKTKIAPPALGGGKVGIFATRTPHRYNPIGITLCKLDSIRIGKNRNDVTLEVSGLDLVDGTPVIDVKPYVPVYDSVVDGIEVKVPHWVAGGLTMQRQVHITDMARSELMNILTINPRALQFYGPKYGEKSIEETLEYVCGCIEQVLGIDVRSSYQTKKSRQGKFQAERSARLQQYSKATSASTINSEESSTRDNADPQDSQLCTQQLDNLLIGYKVQEASERKRNNSEGSGAEDLVKVVSIGLISSASE